MGGAPSGGLHDMHVKLPCIPKGTAHVYGRVLCAQAKRGMGCEMKSTGCTCNHTGTREPGGRAGENHRLGTLWPSTCEVWRINFLQAQSPSIGWGCMLLERTCRTHAGAAGD